jgi:hypothetical protein
MGRHTGDMGAEVRRDMTICRSRITTQNDPFEPSRDEFFELRKVIDNYQITQSLNHPCHRSLAK